MKQHTVKKNFFDLETLPAPEAKRLQLLEEALEKADAECLDIRPPGNIKKPESIAEWLANEAPLKAKAIRDAAAADADEAWRKTALSGAFGRIYCIGYSTNGTTPVAPTLEDFGATIQDIKEGNPVAMRAEMSMLLEWFKTCAYNKCQEGLPQYIGHNITGFDNQFVIQRVTVLRKMLRDELLDIGADFLLPAGFPVNVPPWESDRVFDTMIGWAGRNGRAKLDVVCEALGIAMKGSELKGFGLDDEELDLDDDEFDGSKVVDAVYSGKGKKVSIYCCGDVTRTMTIYQDLYPVLTQSM